MDVVMPQLGETVAEGKILAWHKQVGDEVKEGDILFDVETDKVTVEVQAIAAGRLSEIRVGVGTVARVGAIVAVIGGAAAPAAASTPAPPPAPPVIGLDPFNEVRTATERYPGARGPDDMRMTPLARRLIAQHGVDAVAAAQQAKARGDTRIRAGDVRAALQAAPALQPAPAGKVVPINAVRQRTGERLSESWRSVPHVLQAIDIDFTAVTTVRAHHKDRMLERTGAALTYLPFLARAACLAIRDFPLVNAHLTSDGLAVSADINLGIAVDLSHQGLVVPVVRQAGELTLEGLARAIARQIAKARGGSLTPDDMSGGTYTITNNGSFGTLFTAPIINAPQVAILSTDAIRKRPAVVETPQGEFIAPRPVGIVAQSFDHRAFDGAYAAAYLSRLKEIIERRDWEGEFA